VLTSFDVSAILLNLWRTFNNTR